MGDLLTEIEYNIPKYVFVLVPKSVVECIIISGAESSGLLVMQGNDHSATNFKHIFMHYGYLSMHVNYLSVKSFI